MHDAQLLVAFCLPSNLFQIPLSYWVHRIDAFARSHSHLPSFPAVRKANSVPPNKSPAASAEEAFDGADILVEASRLTEPEPLLRTAVVKPGAFVVPYGTVSAVELDLLDVMDKVVVDDWREAQSGRFGALRRHVDSGRLSAASLHAELGQIVTGQLPGRERADERILFWHRGLAILDIAVGLAILRRAEQEGAGTMLRYR